MATVSIAKRQHGVFGWLVAILFWGFNLLMGVSLVNGIGAVRDVVSTAQPGAESAGAAVGAGLGISMLFAIWFFGAVILGIMMLMTRGKKVTVTKEMP